MRNEPPDEVLVLGSLSPGDDAGGYDRANPLDLLESFLRDLEDAFQCTDVIGDQPCGFPADVSDPECQQHVDERAPRRAASESALI